METLRFPECPREGTCCCALRVCRTGEATPEEIREGNWWARMLLYFAPPLEHFLEEEVLAEVES